MDNGFYVKPLFAFSTSSKLVCWTCVSPGAVFVPMARRPQKHTSSRMTIGVPKMRLCAAGQLVATSSTRSDPNDPSQPAGEGLVYARSLALVVVV